MMHRTTSRLSSDSALNVAESIEVEATLRVPFEQLRAAYLLIVLDVEGRVPERLRAIMSILSFLR